MELHFLGIEGGFPQTGGVVDLSGGVRLLTCRHGVQSVAIQIPEYDEELME
jgi:hypothetical protein